MKRTKHTQKWIDALRSGEYEQTRQVLKNEEGYCCIGVAAHLVSPGDESYADAKRAMGMSDDEMWSLIHRNDGLEGQRTHTFPEIADAIEGMIDE